MYIHTVESSFNIVANQNSQELILAQTEWCKPQTASVCCVPINFQTWSVETAVPAVLLATLNKHGVVNMFLSRRANI